MEPAIKQLKAKLENEDTRYAYADALANAFISAQIKALRDERKLNQTELAARMGTKQSGISRLEKADYSAWKIETLRKLARAFRVRLRISFEPFGTIPDDLKSFDTRHLAPPPFEDDPVLNPSESVEPEVPASATSPESGPEVQVSRYLPPPCMPEPTHTQGRISGESTRFIMECLEHFWLNTAIPNKLSEMRKSQIKSTEDARAQADDAVNPPNEAACQVLHNVA
jgi:transcriptional regulator with XRE-family HTH domain